MKVNRGNPRKKHRGQNPSHLFVESEAKREALRRDCAAPKPSAPDSSWWMHLDRAQFSAAIRERFPEATSVVEETPLPRRRTEVR